MRKRGQGKSGHKSGGTGVIGGKGVKLTRSLNGRRAICRYKPTPAPIAPSRFTASALSGTSAILFWEDDSNHEQGFHVQRSADGGNTWANLTDAPPNATSYPDTGLSAGVPYLYRVSAFNAAGASASASATLNSASPPSFQQTVYSNDFEATVGSEWSTSSTIIDAATTNSPTPNHLLGRLGSGATLSLSNLPADAYGTTLTFDLYVLNNWQGNNGGPTFTVTSDGATLLSTNFTNPPYSGASAPTQAFGGVGQPNGSYPALTGASNIYTDHDHDQSVGGSCGASAPDSVYHLSIPVTHSGTTETITFSGGSGINSIALDNVSVDVTRPTVAIVAPAPANTVPVATEVGPEPGRFIVTRTAASNLGAALPVSIALGGTATLGNHYTLQDTSGQAISGSAPTITIPANQFATYFSVVPIQGQPGHADSTVTATVQPSSPGSATPVTPATGQSTASLTIAAAPYASSATLADPAAGLSITASGGQSRDLYVPATNVTLDGLGVASLNLNATYLTGTYANSAAERWSLAGPGGTSIAQEDFSNGGPSLQLFASGTQANYTLAVGTDLNFNGSLDPFGSSGSSSAPEVSETFNVHVVPMTLDILKDDGSNLATLAKHTTGGYVLADNGNTGYQFDSSGNAIPDYQQTGTNPNDDALRPIVMRADPSILGGRYTLSFGSNIRLFMNADKSGGTDADGNLVTSIVSGQTQFSASSDTKVWVEGIGVSAAQAAEQITMNWMATTGTLGFAGAAVPALAVDSAIETAIDIQGALNVPDYSKYIYTVVAPPGTPAGTWSSDVGKVSAVQDKGADTSRIFWDTVGGIVGKAIYTAGGFSLQRDINIVKIELARLPVGVAFKPFKFGTPLDAGTAPNNPKTFLKKYVASGISEGQNLDPGIVYQARVILSGPLNGRGIAQMQVGFIQTLIGYRNRGIYGAKGMLVSSAEKGVPLTDVALGQNGPWYTKNSPGFFTNPTLANNDVVLTGTDTPVNGPPYYYLQGKVVGVNANDALLTHIDMKLDFTLDLSAATKDTANGANNVYTRRYTVDWTFNGSGDVNAVKPHAWKGTGAGTTTTADNFTPVMDGTSPKLTPQHAADVIPIETFK